MNKEYLQTNGIILAQDCVFALCVPNWTKWRMRGMFDEVLMTAGIKPSCGLRQVRRFLAPDPCLLCQSKQ